MGCKRWVRGLSAGLSALLLAPSFPAAAEVQGELTYLGQTNARAGWLAYVVSPDGNVVAGPVEGSANPVDLSFDGSIYVMSSGFVEAQRHDILVVEVDGVSENLTADAEGHSIGPLISDDGNRVLFRSDASDLVPGDVNERPDLFLMDRSSGLVVNLSAGLNGTVPPYGHSLSGDGSTAVFSVGGTVFLWEGAGSGVFAAGASASVSDDGNVVAYVDGVGNVFVVEREPYRVRWLGFGSDPAVSGVGEVVVSGDGEVVAFERDGGTVRVSPDGDETVIPEGAPVSMSADGNAMTLIGPPVFAPFVGSPYHDHFLWRHTPEPEPEPEIPPGPTAVGGIIQSDTTWTAEGGPYEIGSTVQVPEGITLTIEPGVVVLNSGVPQGGRLFLFYGTIEVRGTANSPVVIDGGGVAHFFSSFGGPATAFLDVSFAQIQNGRSLSNGPAQLSLRNSSLTNLTSTSSVFLPERDVIIENNVFDNAAGFSTHHRLANVYVRGNRFLSRHDSLQGSPTGDYWVLNSAADNGSLTVVEQNTFENVGEMAVALTWGINPPTSASIVARDNYWGTTNPAVIGEMILDRNDDIARASVIEFEPFLQADGLPGKIAALSHSASASEEDGYLEFTVLRQAGASGAASVEFAATSRTATASADFTPVSGTLSWSGSDFSNRVIRIPLVDDALDEESEELLVTLSGLVGAMPTFKTELVGTILDNDEPVPVPVPEPEPEPITPVDDYRNAPNLISLIHATNYSNELDAPILRLYQAYFNREPDLGGAKYWLGIRRGEYPLLAIAEFMAGSQEFSNNYGGLGDEEYLSRVYQNILGRQYDQAGFNYWLDLLQGANEYGDNASHANLSRAEVVFYVTAGLEFIRNYPFTNDR